MDADALYPLLDEKIRLAETLADLRAPGALQAFADVSRLEEKVAELFPPTDTEGAIARRGAVRAAIAAREFIRADALAKRFSSEEGVNEDLKKELSDLLENTHREVVSENELAEERARLRNQFWEILTRVRARRDSWLDEIEQAEIDLGLLKHQGAMALELFAGGLAKEVGLAAIRSELPNLVVGNRKRISWVADALVGQINAPVRILEERNGYVLSTGRESLPIDVVPVGLSSAAKCSWIEYLVRATPKRISNPSEMKVQILHELAQ